MAFLIAPTDRVGWGVFDHSIQMCETITWKTTELNKFTFCEEHKGINGRELQICSTRTLIKYKPMKTNSSVNKIFSLITNLKTEKRWFLNKIHYKLISCFAAILESLTVLMMSYQNITAGSVNVGCHKNRSYISRMYRIEARKLKNWNKNTNSQFLGKTK